MIINEDLLRSAKKGKQRAGQRLTIKYLTGGRLTRQQAIVAKCYDCDCMGESAICDLISCSLYPYSPFKRKSVK